MANVFNAGTPEASRALSGAACAFGVFDGVHLGHRYLLGSALADGADRTAVLTFDIDPDDMFRPSGFRKLMTNEARIAALASTGFDAVVLLPFTKSFAKLEPDAFLGTVFGDAAPASLHVGRDFHFGYKAAGDVDDLKRWGAASGCRICAHDLVSDDEGAITATRIRALLAEGAIEAAHKLLGRRYALEGVVIEGRHEGADMGFRTANLRIDPLLQAVGDGVYAAYVTADGAQYRAAVSVGVPPTFSDTATSTCEAHILDYDGDLYGSTIRIEFVHWLRPMMKFATVEDLIATVTANIEWVRSNL